VLAAPRPRCLLTPLARHLSTHPRDYTPGGIHSARLPISRPISDTVQ
jgi:hypothetical protein